MKLVTSMNQTGIFDITLNCSISGYQNLTLTSLTVNRVVGNNLFIVYDGKILMTRVF